MKFTKLCKRGKRDNDGIERDMSHDRLMKGWDISTEIMFFLLNYLKL